MSPRERMALLDGIVAGLALGHVVGGAVGALLGVCRASPLIYFAGLICAFAGVYVTGRLYSGRRYPFNGRLT